MRPELFEDLVTAAFSVVAVLAVTLPLLSYRVGKRAIAALSMAAMSVLGLVAVLALLLTASYGSTTMYGGLVIVDGFASMMYFVAWVSGMMGLVAASRSSLEWASYPAFHSLVPLVLLGTFFMAGAVDLVLLVSLWMLVSITSYVIIGLPKDRASADASVKYGLMGGVASAFLILWLAMHLSGTGTLRVTGFAAQTAALMGTITLLVFMGFKLGLFPFHWWLPDVYGLGNGYTIAVVAGPIKVAVLALLVRILSSYMASHEDYVRASGTIVAALSALTMTFGNVAAFTTRDLQRMMAYSSIAQVGYLMVPLAAISVPATDRTFAVAAIAVHAFAYALAKTPLFAALGLFKEVAATDLDTLRGLVKVDRAMAISISILLMSLLGVPPLLGFWGKLYMFQSSVTIPWLVVLALINSGLSSAYYVLMVRELLGEPRPENLNKLKELVGRAGFERDVLIASAAVSVLLGLGLASAVLDLSWIMG